MDEKTVDAKKKESKAGSKKGVSRRNFLTAAAAGAAALGFPMIAKAQGPISMRWQSTWPTKDIFHEYALDYAKKVNDMTGGDLKIEVLPAGAVVPAFGGRGHRMVSGYKVSIYRGRCRTEATDARFSESDFGFERPSGEPAGGYERRPERGVEHSNQ